MPLCQIRKNYTYNPDIESTDRTKSTISNLGRALMKKKLLMLELKEIIYDKQLRYLWNLYGYLLQWKKSNARSCFRYTNKNFRKVWTSAKKADGTALTVYKSKNAINKNFGKRLVTPLNFEFFSALYLSLWNFKRFDFKNWKEELVQRRYSSNT